MIRAAVFVPLVLAALLALGWLLLRPALEVAVGYSAKQYCSGEWVAQLPEAFIWGRDVAPRMAVLGPLRGLLRSGTEVTPEGASSRLFGVSASAAYRPGRGCSLHLDGAAAGAAQHAGPARGPVGSAASAPQRTGSLERALEAAFAEPAGGGRNTLAVLVSQRGRLLAERYRAPVSAGTPLQGWSMNKSLLATWVGMQVDRGELSLEQRVRPVLERVEGGGRAAEGAGPDLNLGHLLHMESGLDFEETYFPGDDATRMLYRSRAMWAVAPATGQAYPPGEHFSYSSGDSNLAALLWQQSLGNVPYWQWLQAHFAGPLGLGTLVAEADASGIQVASSYTYMPARDWLRVGQLWLDAWHGRSPLLGREWQRAAVSPRASARDGRYGRGFWLNTGGVAFPGLPASLFYASGNSGQAVVVMPEQELVVVRLGLTENGTDSGLSRLLEAVAAALANNRGLANG